MKFVFVFSFAILNFSIHCVAQEKSRTMLEEQGRELFERKWKPNDELSPNGDGLGPMFNADSCAACHPQGGGAGNEHNVQLLTLVKDDESSNNTSVPRELNEMIPLFEDGGEATTILHRQSTDEDFAAFRNQLLESDLRHGQVSLRSKIENQPAPNRLLRSYEDQKLIITERNSSSLLGLKAIDGIPTSAIREIEVLQRGSNEISGRISLTGAGRVGKFGWRGQSASLSDFVAGACAAEMGLQQKTRPQSLNPLQPNTRISGFDMDATQVQALIAFVSTFPRPKKLSFRLRHIKLRDGRALFTRLDCAVCHVKKLGDVDGIYSDLLLHDMGPKLTDPLPASPHIQLSDSELISLRPRSQGGSYYGGSFSQLVKNRPVIKSNVTQEWRTPPLWGIADTAPYLHDGRASTLDEAIRLHGGEAASSAKKYSELAPKRREALVAFLSLLRSR